MTFRSCFILAAWLVLLAARAATGSFTLATFNVENYLLDPSGTRKAKTVSAREQVVRDLVSIRPDVVALQEIGPPPALAELQQRLKAAGLDLPHSEHVRGWDTNIFVAVLSRFPITARRSHSNDTFLLGGRRLHTSRGIVEVDIAVTPQDRFTLFTAHLKSKRPIGRVDEADLREAEARVLRGHVEAALRRDPQAALVVCGDFNDHPNSRTLRLLLSRGAQGLTDTRPAERAAGAPPPDRGRRGSRSVVWTHFYAQEDSYSRFDYLLVSRSMAARWRSAGSYVLASPGWGLGSDHRPVVGEFMLRSK